MMLDTEDISAEERLIHRYQNQFSFQISKKGEKTGKKTKVWWEHNALHKWVAPPPILFHTQLRLFSRHRAAEELWPFSFGLSTFALFGSFL